MSAPVLDGERPLRDELRRVGALCFVSDLDAPELADDDLHHLRDVLRLSTGERVALSNGAGGVRFATVCAAAASPGGRRRARSFRLDLDEAIVCEAPVSEPVSVAFGLQKGERAEWTVQKLTEIGIDRIVPLVTARTIVRLEPAERARRGARLARIAAHAAAQSRRARLPVVEEPTELAALARTGALCLAEPGGRPLLPRDRALAVGPEGGWTPDELALADERVGLGETVLRAETAALVAATLLVDQRARADASGLAVPPPSSAATW